MSASLLLLALAAAPQVRHWNSRKVKLKYAVTDATGLGKVELWMTTDGGKTWAKACEDEDLTSPVQFTAPSDGRYSFAFVMEDKVGNRGPEPKSGWVPRRVLAVDTAPPELSLSLSGRFAGPAKAVKVTWSCKDPNLPASPVSLRLALAGGERVLADALEPSGSFEWRPGPEVQGEFRILASASDLAGNVSRAGSEMITADPLPPSATVAAPKKVSSDVLSVAVRAEDEGGSGLAEILLFASEDAGKTWRIVARGKPPGGELAFPVRPGEWWLCAGAADKSGNSNPERTVQARVTVEKPPLKLVILEQPPALRGGDRFKLRWRCEPAEAKLKGGVDVYWRPSPGSAWEPLAASRPPEGEFAWEAPLEDHDKAQFRLEARSSGGGTASVLSREFIIDASAPVAVLDFDFGEPVLEPRAEPPRAPAGAPRPAPREALQSAPLRPPDAGNVRSLIEAGEYVRAAKEATSLLSANPADAGALVLRSRAKARMGDLDGAEADLMRAAALPEPADAGVLLPRVLLAKAARSREDRSRSARFAKLAMNAVGDASTAEGLVSRALARYMLASLEPAGSVRAKGMLDEAREGFEQALAVSPGELEGICRWYLARIMESRGRVEEAKEHWSRAAELFPEGSRQREFAESRGSP